MKYYYHIIGDINLKRTRESSRTMRWTNDNWTMQDRNKWGYDGGI